METETKTMNLGLKFSDPNTATISSELDNGARVEIVFQGAAQHLTRRAKVRVAMAARETYCAESYRLSDGPLLDSQVFNDDGSIGIEREDRPNAPTM